MKMPRSILADFRFFTGIGRRWGHVMFDRRSKAGPYSIKTDAGPHSIKTDVLARLGTVLNKNRFSRAFGRLAHTAAMELKQNLFAINVYVESKHMRKKLRIRLRPASSTRSPARR